MAPDAQELLSIDGLWTLEYEGDAYLAGGGVVVVAGDKIVGGDSWYYYQGTVSRNGDFLTARVDVRAFISSATTVFGNSLKEFTVTLQGQVKGNVMRGRLIPSFGTSQSVGVTLLRRL